MGNHMEPSKKSSFVPKMINFTKLAIKSENENLLGSILFVDIKEPKTPGTTWNHLKMHFSSKNDLLTKRA